MDPLPGALLIWASVVGVGYIYKRQRWLGPVVWFLISVIDVICTILLLGAIAWHINWR